MAMQPAFKSYFTARDELDAALDDGELTLTGPQNAVLRYLIEHVVFDKRADDWGWVTTDAAAVDVIARRTGLSARTVKSALAELEDKRLISRFHQPKLAGGRRPDRIRVDGLFNVEDDTPEHVAPKVQEMHLRESAGVAPYEGAGDAPSYLCTEELLEQPAEAGPAGKTGPSAQDSGESPEEQRAWLESLRSGAARQRVRDELEKILPELAEMRFGGDVEAAREDLAIWGDPRSQLDKAKSYVNRPRAGLVPQR